VFDGIPANFKDSASLLLNAIAYLEQFNV
jgi:hypothetical protein